MIFSFKRHLPLSLVSLTTAFPNQLFQSSPCQIDIICRCCSCFLLKSVKHVNSLAELREVKDAMLNARVDTDFINTLANGCHRLPVLRFQTLLDEV